MAGPGIEPGTPALLVMCSTTDLHVISELSRTIFTDHLA